MERSPEDGVQLQSTAPPQFLGHGSQSTEVIVDEVIAGDARHDAVGLCRDRPRLVADGSVLEFAAGGDLLENHAAIEPVAGQRFKIIHAANRRNGPPRALDAVEAGQEELVDGARQDAADAVGGPRSLKDRTQGGSGQPTRAGVAAFLGSRDQHFAEAGRPLDFRSGFQGLGVVHTLDIRQAALKGERCLNHFGAAAGRLRHVDGRSRRTLVAGSDQLFHCLDFLGEFSNYAGVINLGLRLHGDTRRGFHSGSHNRLLCGRLGGVVRHRNLLVGLSRDGDAGLRVSA